MKPMLSAAVKDLDAIKFPVLLSPKLDGIRCVILAGIPVTRNFKHVPNRAIFHALKGLRLPPLDGELIVGSPTAEDCYRATNSGVMSQDGEPDWCYHVFDCYDESDGFVDRLRVAAQILKKLGHPRIKMVPHTTASSVDEVEDYETKQLALGYEGIMGRDPEGYYKSGRSTMREGGLWKLKRFFDGEAKIIGFEERMHNDNELTKDELGRAKRSSHKANRHGRGDLGALKVRDCATGVEFDIGTGFSDDERSRIWGNREEWLGVTVKYKSQPVGVKDKPRFPVYLGLRTDL